MFWTWACCNAQQDRRGRFLRSKKSMWSPTRVISGPRTSLPARKPPDAACAAPATRGGGEERLFPQGRIPLRRETERLHLSRRKGADADPRRQTARIEKSRLR